jgi:hypothetical protein
MATRSEILDTAREYVTQDRAATHGDAERNFNLIADYWSAHLDAEHHGKRRCGDDDAAQDRAHQVKPETATIGLTPAATWPAAGRLQRNDSLWHRPRLVRRNRALPPI